jgi:hypothetical protein
MCAEGADGDGIVVANVGFFCQFARASAR